MNASNQTTHLSPVPRSIVAAAVGTVVVFVFSMLTLIGSTAFDNAIAPQGESVFLDYGPMIEFQAIIALIAGAISFVLTVSVRRRPYLVRSVKNAELDDGLRSSCGSALARGQSFDVSHHMFQPLQAIDAIGVAGFLGAPLGYRVWGFTDPHGVSKLLRQGKVNEAHAVMAATAATRGKTPGKTR